MCLRLKYGIWNVGSPEKKAVEALQRAGYGAITARVLSARGYDTPEKAGELLSADAPLVDPMKMKDMDLAVRTVEEALEKGSKIAVYGDYDVDGITATCILLHYLRGRGANCIAHIPSRLEEGYGLNEKAVRQLRAEGVDLIITVDCGITAIEEADLCRELGVTLVITDHHECKEELPVAAAVVDPHRPDGEYPHKNLCGAGVAFKLVAALDGDQEKMAEEYCDLVCLGTIADVMELSGENRRMVVQGLKDLNHPRRLGIRALVEACSKDKKPITASTIGYTLSPRINAAGRMERAELAVKLFLTEDPREAESLAKTLCRLNKERQTIESDIFADAKAQLKKQGVPKHAIILAGETWHQGVVGIVASRLCEEYCLPTFLICLSGDRGKGSSRSYGGLNLFASLSEMKDIMEEYGGHELAAGFTIARKNVEEFRRRMSRCAERCEADRSSTQTVLHIDCELTGDLLTERNVEELDQLEPCGTGCAKPLFSLSDAVVDRVNIIGGGKHLRLRLGTGCGYVQAVCFCAGDLVRKLEVGQHVDVAFQLDINEYRGYRNLQLNVQDMRLTSPSELYERWCRGDRLNYIEKKALKISRNDVVAVWRYLTRLAPAGTPLHSQTDTLCLGIAQASGCSVRRVLPCLDILKELGFLALDRNGSGIEIRVLPNRPHNPLENSSLYQSLRGD